ncbi:short-chain dehydrogenase, partial [bacterium SM23_31]
MSDSKKVKHGNALKGKVALITGGASGIGQAITLMFAREGAAVSMMDIDRGGGQSVMQKIADTGGRAIFIPGDVSRSKDCHQAVRQTCEELGGLDVLVNNAGVIRRAAVTETGEKEWDHVMAVNVKSVFLLSRYAIPVMAGVGGGVIINIASG